MDEGLEHGAIVSERRPEPVVAGDGVATARVLLDLRGEATGSCAPGFVHHRCSCWPRSPLDIVNVCVTVSDTRGRTVADLRPEDFHVVEDGVSQDVVLFTEQRVPLSVALPRC